MRHARWGGTHLLAAGTILAALCAVLLPGCSLHVRPSAAWNPRAGETTLSVATSGTPLLPSGKEATRNAPPNEALPLAGKVTAPERGAYLGVYAPPAPFKISKLDDFDNIAGKRVSIVMWYQPWASTNRLDFDAGTVAEVMRRGAVPMITWEPWDPGNDANLLISPADQPKYRLSAIARGDFDPYIRHWAKELRQIGGPVMLRPMHEMNGTWYPWGGRTNGNTPAQFIAAWRHMHDIFQQEGAVNVTWVWSVNCQSAGASETNTYDMYYPGDAYVDWAGVSAFNWGTAAKWSRWTPYSKIMARPLAYLRTLYKPIVIAEFGCVEQDGDKATWFRDAYAQIAADPTIKAVVYYNGVEKSAVDQQDWRIDTTQRSLAGYREAVAPAYFVQGAPAPLWRWWDSLSDYQRRYLASLRFIY